MCKMCRKVSALFWIGGHFDEKIDGIPTQTSISGEMPRVTRGFNRQQIDISELNQFSQKLSTRRNGKIIEKTSYDNTY